MSGRCSFSAQLEGFVLLGCWLKKSLASFSPVFHTPGIWELTISFRDSIAIWGKSLTTYQNHNVITTHLPSGHCTVWWILAMGLADLLGIADLSKGRKYQKVKTQTQSHVRRPVVWTNRWQIWVFFSIEFFWGTTGICHTSLWRFPEAL